MRRSDIILLALAATALAAPAARAESPTWREQSELVRDVKGVGTLTLENARGEVNVRASADGRLHIKALKIARARSLDEAKRIANDTVVELDASGGRLALRVRYPHLHVRLNLWEDMSDDRMPRNEVRLAVEVPPTMALEVDAASGDISTAGLAASQRLNAASGDITVNDAAGPLTIGTASGDVTLGAIAGARVATASGDVQVDGARGALQLSTASGDVTVNTVRDSIQVRTTSGTVRVDGAPRGADLASTSGSVSLGSSSGRVRARTVSGDLEVRLRAPVASADLSTQSGTLALTLEPEVACTLEARTGSGEIDIAGTAPVTRQGRGSMTARFRGGGAPVGLRTVSGDIRVVVGGGK